MSTRGANGTGATDRNARRCVRGLGTGRRDLAKENNLCPMGATMLDVDRFCGLMLMLIC